MEDEYYFDLCDTFILFMHDKVILICDYKTYNYKSKFIMTGAHAFDVCLHSVDFFLTFDVCVHAG